MQVLEDDVEVARLKLDESGEDNPTYANVPTIGAECVEIEFIEVATAAHGHGVAAGRCTGLRNGTPTVECWRTARKPRPA